MSLLRESIRKHLLLEKRIAQLRSQIFITYDVKVDDRSHSENRLKERDIETKKIKDIITLSIDEITNKIILNEVGDYDDIIIRSRSTGLFVPVVLREKNPYNFMLIVKSAYYKERAGRPQLTIWVD
jgi:hypothetical protein